MVELDQLSIAILGAILLGEEQERAEKKRVMEEAQQTRKLRGGTATQIGIVTRERAVAIDWLQQTSGFAPELPLGIKLRFRVEDERITHISLAVSRRREQRVDYYPYSALGLARAIHAVEEEEKNA